MDVKRNDFLLVGSGDVEVSRFVDSYESFTRVLESLQRKYEELEEEFTAQNKELSEANEKLVGLTARNIAATEFLNSILHSITAGVVAVDERGHVTHFNRAAARVFNIAAASVLGRPYEECIPRSDPPEANVLDTLTTGVTHDAMERQMTPADGAPLRLSVSTGLLRDAHGTTTGAVEVIHDLTKLKKMEQDLARLNTLAALGEMAATIAHEVRNPLSGIAGFASLLAADLEGTDPRYQLVQKIIQGAEILNETITTLLNYTRFDETNKRDIDLLEFVQSSIEQFRQDNVDRTRNIRFRFHTDGGCSFRGHGIMLDPLLFRQIFFNLFTNAIEACSGSGEIEVRVAAYLRDTTVERFGDKVALELDETVVEIAVADRGPGIPDDQLERVFAPFFSNKEGGNGLGLAVALKIMKAHGGEIVAENSDTGGAVFRLLLPVKLDAIRQEV